MSRLWLPQWRIGLPGVANSDTHVVIIYIALLRCGIKP
jgi:hypothetical protein